MSITPRFSQRTLQFGDQPISELMRVALARPELISLAAGFVDQASLPVEITQRAADFVLSDAVRARAALQYGTNAGLLALRAAVLERMQAADGQRGPQTSVEQVLMTAGSNQLLHLVGEVLLDPGDIVLCAAPTYFVFLGMLQSLRARGVGIAVDEQGMNPDSLREQLDRLDRSGELARVKAIYVTSYFENPSTLTLSLERRAQVVELAKRYSKHSPIYVIDDAAYRLLRYSGDDLPGLRTFDEDGTTVIVAETFSKSFSPGLRVGWGVLPRALVPPVAALKGSIDFGSPHFNQHLLAAVLENGWFEPHVASLQVSYRVKMHAMLEALQTHLADVPDVRWHVPTGGLYVWLELPESLPAGSSGSLVEQALAEGVLYVPGEYCFPPEGEPVHKNRIRLSFGVQDAPNLKLGIEKLARAIRRALS